MNFHNYKKDQCLYNKSHQVIYIAEYIYFIDFKNYNQVDSN